MVAQPTCNRQVSGFESPLGLISGDEGCAGRGAGVVNRSRL